MSESKGRQEHRTCDICGCPKVALRRPSRTVYYCPHNTDQAHKNERARRKFAATTARIEAIVNRTGA